jgi:hypothetical protein
MCGKGREELLIGWIVLDIVEAENVSDAPSTEAHNEE